MKTLRVVLAASALGLLATHQVNANEQTQVLKRIIKDNIAYCAELEPEYREQGQSTEEYMLECVNEHLESDGHPAVSSLHPHH